MTSMQLYPPLDAATEAALRASIERFGVLVPVVVTQEGELLDGHHRSRIAGALGVEFESRVVQVSSADEAREVARTLNEDRRMLTREQRLPVVVALREEGHSARAIAGALGVHHSTVVRDIGRGGADAPPAHVEGLDGKSYPATRRREGAEPQPPASRSRPATGNTPYNPESERARARARGQFDRIAHGLAEINGICRGLRDIDYGMAVSVADPDEIAAIAARASDLARSLREVRTRLEEANDRKEA